MAKFNWKRIGEAALTIAGQAIPAVGVAEATAKTLFGKKDLTSQEKQDLALQLVLSGVESVEGVTGQDLLADAQVEAATRGVIDAFVSLQNAVHAAQAARTHTSPQ